MIDLSALGLSNVPAPLHGGKRDKAGNAHEHGKDSKSFDDLVNDAGKKGAKKNAGDEDAVDALDLDPLVASIDDLEGDEAAGTAVSKDGKDVLSGLKTQISAAETADQEGRVRLSAAFQQLMKSNADAAGQRDAGTEPKAGDAKPDVEPEVKNGKAENIKLPNTANTGLNTGKIQLAAAGEEKETSPSKELHALLGMTAMSADDADDQTIDAAVEKRVAKSDKRGEDDTTVDAKSASVTLAAEAAKTEIKSDAGAQQTPAHHATGQQDDAAQADTQQVGTQQLAAQQVAAQQSAAQATIKAPANAPVRADADDVQKPAENDRNTVRLVSSDGKSAPVDIELAKATGSDSAEPASAGKVDFVTVLDSRRYLGFSNDGGAGNTSALANAIKAEPSWAQVIHGVNTGANRTVTEVNTLKLQMSPEHLGNMTASLRLKGDELSVEVRVETVDAYRQLSSDQDSIVKALKDQGFSIDQVSIQLSPSAKADGGQGSASQNNGSQSGNDQNLQQGGQGDNTRQRDESARRNANQSNWTGNDQTSTYSDSGNGSDDTDSGDLYL